jgi:hypothetical protein
MQQHRSSGGYQTTMRTSSKGPKECGEREDERRNERKATSSGNKVIFPKDRVPREVRASEHEITARRRRRRRQEREAGKQETSFATEVFLLTFMGAGRGAGGGIVFPFSSLALGAALGKGEIYCKSAIILPNSVWAKTMGPPPGCLLSHLMGCLKISVSHYFCIA